MSFSGRGQQKGGAERREWPVSAPLSRAAKVRRTADRGRHTQSCTSSESTSLMAFFMRKRSFRSPEGSCDAYCSPQYGRAEPQWRAQICNPSGILLCFALLVICSLVPVSQQAGVYLVTYGGNNISLGTSASLSRTYLYAAWPSRQLFLTIWQHSLLNLGAAAVRIPYCSTLFNA